MAMSQPKEIVYWHDFDCDGVGVLTWEEVECGSDFDFDENGVMIATDPVLIQKFSLLDGSFETDSLDEIQKDIHGLLTIAYQRGLLEQMCELLNTE